MLTFNFVIIFSHCGCRSQGLYRCSGDLLDRTRHPWTFVNVIFLHSDVCIFFRCGVCVFYGNIIRFSLVLKTSIIEYNKMKKYYTFALNQVISFRCSG